ncbi:molybdopterin-dependent oxidoreductase [Maliponia aquimaris]|uniref:Oxidoreductase molybdopterin binding domain protein n=1 Tax=Maliponia aquimaris TaxID=1673631 RepID=A0A238KUZ1_9RHOB|nr:molybdopterin-dependent oxidoreductase [Maliponia aquimaris]SMX46653.1 Oxidoreductase molybdopterin binding domain protein [Maliponia aquimaris]
MPRYLILALSMLASLACGPVLALDAPAGSPLLTVSGDLTVTNADDVAVFDLDMLHALEWREIDTYTPYSEGPQRFAGPTLASLLEALGVTEGTLLAIALNDYAIDIPVSDARDFDVLLAIEHNGEAMRPRNKGPIWVIYPMNGTEPLTEAHGSRMIWQLNRITVRP